ncbi:MAG TPA: hypothetical protein VMF52_06990 [Steroidobacteraceae bacterium]|nr:hypothetical protein [Steroidobacteraceae bacterium]
MKRTTLGALATLAIALTNAAPALAAPPTTSAYNTDPQHSYVEDATSRGIGQVNMITCIMSAMRPDALVNDGAYNALVDMQKCDPNARGASDTATGASAFATATVNSTRTSNTEPMRARIWIDDPETPGAIISVNLSATAPASTGNPYGVFRLDYCGKMDGTPGCAFNGFLEGAAGGVSYYEQEQGGGGGGTKALRLSTTSATTGSGSLHMEDGGNNSATFSFAYNADYYRRSDDGGEQCFARDARDPDTGLSVWKYGLYDSTTGARIERHSGFPIEYTHAGTKYQGYLGYYGLSLPPAAQEFLENGDTVDKVDYGDNGGTPTRTPYTVIKAGGKLTKYTRHTRTLHEIDKIKFMTFVGMEANGFFSGAQQNTSYELYWDDAAGSFKVTGQMNCGGNGCNVQALQSVQTVPASFWAARGGIQGNSQQLGGEVFVNLQGVGSPVNSDQVQVVYRSQDLVYPSQLPAALHCLRDCPTAATISAFFSQGSQAQSPFVAATANNFQPTQPNNVVDYTSNAATALLLDGASAAVVLDVDREALENSMQFRNGLRTGKLFVNLADAECDTGSGTYCEWRVNNLDVYYQWETGPASYNQFAAVKDSSGQFVNFDAPLQVNFHVPQGAAYGQYAGQNLVLQYNGFGELWGLPGYCVSPQTNEEVECNGGDVRYVPSIVIPHDATNGVVTTNGTTYYVKWLEREIRFARKSLSVCDGASLVVPSGVTLPTAADLRDPSDSASPIYTGTRPTVTAAPRVIQGDVKY